MNDFKVGLSNLPEVHQFQRPDIKCPESAS